MKALSAALVASLLPLAALAEVPNGTIRTEAGDSIEVTEVAGGLEHPWGMAFLPDGRILLTERPGRLRLIDADGTLREEELAGVPSVFATGQGGLLDIELDPDFAANQIVWLSYAEAGAGGTAGTAVGHGRFANDAIEGFEVVWRMQDKVPGKNHFGSRIVFADDGTLYITTGERFRFEPAQDLSQTLGKVVRITREGAPAPGNPFLDREDALPEIYSYGHRNIQAAAIDPATGALYVAEMGPKGGDELNRIEPGANYGWPLVSWGTHYDGADIPDPPTRPEFTDALIQWTPVIAPSGMIFYRGDLFADFKGHALIGGLQAEGLTRLELKDGEVVDQELIPLGARIREVAEGPDGALYVLTDDSSDGAVWKLAPLGASN
jgi:glucose/arabinose dehydrogenase